MYGGLASRLARRLDTHLSPASDMAAVPPHNHPPIRVSVLEMLRTMIPGQGKPPDPTMGIRWRAWQRIIGSEVVEARSRSWSRLLGTSWNDVEVLLAYWKQWTSEVELSAVVEWRNGETVERRGMASPPGRTGAWKKILPTSPVERSRWTRVGLASRQQQLSSGRHRNNVAKGSVRNTHRTPGSLMTNSLRRDSRIPALIRNGLQEKKRSFFVVVGDRPKDAIVHCRLPLF